MLITKTFEFSYAHILPNHNGKCRKLHGHNAVVEVTVGSLDLQPGGSSEGMVMDFGDLKNIVKNLVLDKWDHFFLAKGDEWVVEAARRWDENKPTDTVGGWDVSYQIVNIGVRVTAENLANLIFAKLEEPILQMGKGNVYLHAIKFFETPNSWAEAKGDN